MEGAWRHDGWIDETGRCRARLVERRWPEPLLSGPLLTTILLTDACNLHCSHCFVERQADPQEMTFETLRSLFGELEAMGSPVVDLAGGEPLLRRDFWPVLDALGEYGTDARLCTNATLIDDSVAARLAHSPIRSFSVSVDGPDAAFHDIVRGRGSYERACSGIRSLLAAGATDVTLRVTVSAVNVDHLLAFADLTARLGVSKIVFKPFRMTGAARRQQWLNISRARYTEAVLAAYEKWPHGAGMVQVQGEMPVPSPVGKSVVPGFSCVGGTLKATVTGRGAVVACGSVLTPKDWTLAEHGFGECWRSAPNLSDWRTLTGDPRCLSCPEFARCRGGCRARALGSGGSLNDPDSWACDSIAQLRSIEGAGRAPSSSSEKG